MKKLSFFAAISLGRLDVFSRIGVYVHPAIADLILFLLHAYGVSEKIQWMFMHQQSDFIGAPRNLRPLCACGRNDDLEGRLVSNKDAIDCLLVAVRRQEISSSLVGLIDNAVFKIIDFYDPSYSFVRRQEVAKFKDCYRGRRCFIIGNGPSLRIKDLDMLHKEKEITFGVNKIYRAFDRTAWRPDFFVVGDYKTFAYSKEEILALNLPCKIFIGIDELVPETVQCIRLNHCWTPYFPNAPRFSDDVEASTFILGTVVYECLQLAAYMGFTEIYLSGVDNTMHSDFHKPNHFIQDYISHDEAEYLERSGMRIGTVACDRAYRRAEAHSRANRYRIFNATRGGRLDAFEIVDFDSLF